jgi:hypothetical protein
VLAVPERHETVTGQLPGSTCLPTLQVQLTLPAASDVAGSSSGPDGYPMLMEQSVFRVVATRSVTV